ncbi:MAG: hypothetical protein EPN82_15665 [Bacteroidetes bacterium]|nr:MAG: hypothetical protein EPN82_15665 [Bacteroidota bacterium]
MQKESKRAQKGFLLYRNLGDGRSIERIASELNIKIDTVKRWEKEWDWEQRLKEEEQTKSDELKFKSLVKEHEEMSIQITKSLDKIIELFTEKLSNSDEYFDKMEIEDLIKLINNYIKSIPKVLDYIQTFTMEPLKEKELEESFSIIKLINEDEIATNLSLEILSRISNK